MKTIRLHFHKKWMIIIKDYLKVWNNKCIIVTITAAHIMEPSSTKTFSIEWGPSKNFFGIMDLLLSLVVVFIQIIPGTSSTKSEKRGEKATFKIENCNVYRCIILSIRLLKYISSTVFLNIWISRFSAQTTMLAQYLKKSGNFKFWGNTVEDMYFKSRILKIIHLYWSLGAKKNGWVIFY